MLMESWISITVPHREMRGPHQLGGRTRRPHMDFATAVAVSDDPRRARSSRQIPLGTRTVEPDHSQADSLALLSDL